MIFPTKPLSTGRPILQRFAMFSAVGAGGVAVQTLMLAILLRVGEMHYLAATAVAVEASVLNNFIWHRRWTWADRPRTFGLWALLRFNVTNGLVSLAANLMLMSVFVSCLRINPILANLLTISICSIANFVIADRVVFAQDISR